MSVVWHPWPCTFAPPCTGSCAHESSGQRLSIICPTTMSGDGMNSSLLHERVITHLERRHQVHTGLCHFAGDRFAIVDVQRERLFDEDVLARPRGRDRERRV